MGAEVSVNSSPALEAMKPRKPLSESLLFTVLISVSRPKSEVGTSFTVHSFCSFALVKLSLKGRTNGVLALSVRLAKDRVARRGVETASAVMAEGDAMPNDSIARHKKRKGKNLFCIGKKC